MASPSSAAAEAAGDRPEFVIGVTGHRDAAADDRDRVAEDLRTILRDLSGRFMHARVCVATGLAAGADTLAAEIALDLGLTVKAILPMPQSAYEADFEGADLAQFRALLDRPGVEVREIPVAEHAGAGALDSQPARDAQYALLADYLTRRSNVLIAIWDGQVNGLPGGTSDVVLRYLADGQEQDPNPLDAPVEAEDCGNLVVWVPTGRDTTGDDGPAGDVRYLVSNGNYDCYWQETAIPGHYANRWRGFDGYAADWASAQGRDLAAYGLAEPADAESSADALALDVQFIRADQLARAFQGWSNRMFAAFGLMAAAMGLAFLIYAKLLAAKAFLIVYVALFVIGFIGFRYSAKQHLHSRHLAYRALAETFRVQFFLMLSGAGGKYHLRRILSLTSVDRFQRLEWLQDAVRCAEPLVYFGHCARENALAVVRGRWIDDQKTYFDKKLHQLHAQHRRLESIKGALLVGSAVGALALIFFKKTLIHLEMAGYDGKAWLVFFMGLLPLWAAIWELYQGKMATKELLWQYSNQRRYFHAAAREIDQAKTLAEGQKIIRNLADRALVEIYLWSVHRYHREHEPPAAG